MKRNLQASASVLAFVAAAFVGGLPAKADAWGEILFGNYISVGVNIYGTFGNGYEFGDGIMFDQTGTGTFDPDFDFLAPGSPFDGFAINDGETTLIHNNNDFFGYDPNVPGTLTNFSGVEFAGETWDNRIIWQTETADLLISHDYFFNDNDQQVQIRTSITAKSDIAELYFTRAVDPDAVVSDGDSSTTRNIIEQNPVVTSVYGETLVSLYLMGLLAFNDQEGVDGVRARLNTSWGFDTNYPTNGEGEPDGEYYGLDANQMYNNADDGGDFGASGTESDDVIALAFDLGSLLTGETRSFLYSYIFGDDFCSFGGCVTAAGTTVTLERTVAMTQTQMARLSGALTRLAHQELQVQVPVSLGVLSISTQGTLEPGPRFALRIGGTYAENADTGTASVGSMTAAMALSDTLTLGGSVEDGSTNTRIGGFEARGTASSLAVYLRSRNVDGQGLTWRVSAGYASGTSTYARGAGFPESEGGFGTASNTAVYGAVDIGYAVRFGGLTLTPNLRLAQSSATRGAYTETNAVGFPLSFDAFTESATTVTVSFDSAFDLSARSALTLGLGFSTDLSRTSPNMTGTSTIEGLETFNIASAGVVNSTRAFANLNYRYAFDQSNSLLATVRAAQDMYSSAVTANFGLHYEVRF